MRKEYDIEKLNPRRNPYANRLEKQITINMDNNAIEYFTSQSGVPNIPYPDSGSDQAAFAYSDAAVNVDGDLRILHPVAKN